MLHMIFIANPHMMLWLPLRASGPQPRGPDEMVEWIRSGDWPLPAVVGEQFVLPPKLRLDVRRHGRTIVTRADPPLRERRPAPILTADQGMVLHLMARGLTADQIALALYRRRRWVCYQMAEVRRKLGVTTRAAVLKSRRR